MLRCQVVQLHADPFLQGLEALRRQMPVGGAGQRHDGLRRIHPVVQPRTTIGGATAADAVLACQVLDRRRDVGD